MPVAQQRGRFMLMLASYRTFKRGFAGSKAVRGAAQTIPDVTSALMIAEPTQVSPQRPAAREKDIFLQRMKSFRPPRARMPQQFANTSKN